MERLDKILSNSGVGTRKEVREIIRKGRVRVNGEIIKKPEFQADPEISVITLDDEKLNLRKYIYLIMNKPEGVLSATEDDHDKTVIDLLSDEMKRFMPFPSGRLDKDTTGLLILTNDGELNHRLISPKWGVLKTYEAEIMNPLTEKDKERFRKGITLDDGFRCREAVLEEKEGKKDTALVTIHEGKFHQVKRMFEAVGNKVLKLKRISFGPLVLPYDLSEGSYRELTEEELSELLRIVKLEQ